MSEFVDVEACLMRYRPAAPSEAARLRIAALVRAEPRVSAQRWRLVAACVAIALLSAAGWWASHGWLDPGAAEPIPDEFARKWAASPRETLVGAATHSRVAIELFMDWQCPSCLVLQRDLAPILALYEQTQAGQISLIVRDWPWSPTCNPHVPGEMHHVACEAAAAVRVTRNHQRDVEMIDWLRANQERLNDPGARARVLHEAARLVPIPDLDAEHAAAMTAIQEDIALGAALRIGATPTVFVNGVRLMTPKAAEVRWAIELELARVAK
jgi:protein-disulfide isomerase